MVGGPATGSGCLWPLDVDARLWKSRRKAKAYPSRRLAVCLLSSFAGTCSCEALRLLQERQQWLPEIRPINVF